MLLTVTLLVRLWMGWTIGVKHLGDRLLVRNLLLLPVRDLFAFAVWIVSLAGNRVEWRGREYRILQGGRMFDTTAAALPLRRDGGGAPPYRGGQEILLHERWSKSMNTSRSELKD